MTDEFNTSNKNPSADDAADKREDVQANNASEEATSQANFKQIADQIKEAELIDVSRPEIFYPEGISEDEQRMQKEGDGELIEHGIRTMDKLQEVTVADISNEEIEWQVLEHHGLNKSTPEETKTLSAADIGERGIFDVHAPFREENVARKQKLDLKLENILQNGSDLVQSAVSRFDKGMHDDSTNASFDEHYNECKLRLIELGAVSADIERFDEIMNIKREL